MIAASIFRVSFVVQRAMRCVSFALASHWRKLSSVVFPNGVHYARCTHPNKMLHMLHRAQVHKCCGDIQSSLRQNKSNSRRSAWHMCLHRNIYIYETKPFNWIAIVDTSIYICTWQRLPCDTNQQTVNHLCDSFITESAAVAHSFCRKMHLRNEFTAAEKCHWLSSIRNGSFWFSRSALECSPHSFRIYAIFQ